MSFTIYPKKNTYYENQSSPGSDITQVYYWDPEENEEITPRQPPRPQPLPIQEVFRQIPTTTLYPPLSSNNSFEPCIKQVQKHTPVMKNYRLTFTDFSSRLEALNEAVEQIRVTRLGMALDSLKWEKINEKLSLLEEAVHNAIKILPKPSLHQEGRFHKDFLIRQKTLFRKALGECMQRSENLHTLIKKKLKYIGASYPYLKPKLDDLHENVESIRRIFSHRIFKET